MLKFVLSFYFILILTACSDFPIFTRPANLSRSNLPSSPLSLPSLSSSLGSNEGEQCEPRYCILVSKENGETRYQIRNPQFGALSYHFEISGENIDVSPAQLVQGVVLGGVTQDLARVRSLDKAIGSEWKTQLNYILGSSEALHDDTYTYALPYSLGESYQINQGYGGSFSHQNDLNRYALDFGLPEGSSVLAARAGQVVDIVQEYVEGRVDPALKDKANYIAIEHSDQTQARYLHIQTQSARVSVGQTVEVGDVLALSSNVGYTSGPHLHFAVTQVDAQLKLISLPVFFNTLNQGRIRLEEGQIYTAL